jgi:hypothetical protein
MPVRREALWVLATKRPDLAVDPLRRALLDNHVSMRETARQFLTVANIRDARNFYMETIAQGSDSQRYAAICGVGETGQAPDASLLLSYLDSPLPKLRRAAIRAIGKLDADRYHQKLFTFLAHEKPGISREAMKALLPKARLLSLEDLEQLAATGASFHIRRNALTLALHTSKWQKLPALLNACVDEDLKLAELAKRGLRDWFVTYNRSFAEPTRTDFEKISVVLSRVEPMLPHGAAKELRDCLQLYFK